MFTLLRTHLAHRLTVQVILFSSAIAVLATGFQLYIDYRHDVQGIYQFFELVEKSSIRPLEESVWILDDFQIELQLEGLIKRQDITYAAVSMDGKVSWAKGTPGRDTVLEQTFPLVHRVRDSVELIGLLRVEASCEGIYQRLWERVIILLISNALKTSLVSGFILLLFQRSVTSHLTKLASHAQQINIKETPSPFMLDRPPTRTADELDHVVRVLNDLYVNGHQAIALLQVQEQRLRHFFDATQEVIFGVDVEGQCTFINRAGLRHFAVPDQGAIVGGNLLARMAAQCNKHCHPCMLRERVLATIREKRVILTDEIPFCGPDGRILQVTLRSYPVFEQDRCVGAIVFFADISTQQKLEQEKQLFSKVFRQAPALLLIADAEGKVEYVNKSFEQVIGCETATVIGKGALECFHDFFDAEKVVQVRAAVLGGTSWSGTVTKRRADGSRFSLEATIFPIHDRNGQITHVVAMARNITREMELVEQLHHAQKLEAIGKMAASIAHEFGNPLLGIRFALRDVQQREGLDSEDKKLLHLAEEECDRMRKLIRDLQQFNRPTNRKKTIFDLHRLLDDICALNQNLLAKHAITLNREFAGQPALLTAVEDQIRQVCINLLLNAIDAMAAKGGLLRLRTEVRSGELVFSFGDNGPGIREENLDRIFEPFFTTKASAEGTGLGLPVSYGIVKAHGGSIQVRSIPGDTVFTVVLPRGEPV